MIKKSYECIFIKEIRKDGENIFKKNVFLSCFIVRLSVELNQNKSECKISSVIRLRKTFLKKYHFQHNKIENSNFGQTRKEVILLSKQTIHNS